jgi:ATP-binding cassette subfamily B (MDR/TAP) protein 1
MNAFTLSTGEEMVEQGDFYSLMFFVVALTILVIYFLFGFYTNEVSQVSIFSRSHPFRETRS